MIFAQRWRFDQTDGSGRLDGERSGFSSAAHRVRFHGNDGKILIASGTAPISDLRCDYFQLNLCSILQNTMEFYHLLLDFALFLAVLTHQIPYLEMISLFFP